MGQDFLSAIKLHPSYWLDFLHWGPLRESLDQRPFADSSRF